MTPASRRGGNTTRTTQASPRASPKATATPTTAHAACPQRRKVASHLCSVMSDPFSGLLEFAHAGAPNDAPLRSSHALDDIARPVEGHGENNDHGHSGDGDSFRVAVMETTERFRTASMSLFPSACRLARRQVTVPRHSDGRRVGGGWTSKSPPSTDAGWSLSWNGNALVLGSPGAEGMMSSREGVPPSARKEGNVQVRLDVTDGHTICRPVGALDAYSAPGLRGCMALLASVPKLVVDLSEVPFIDSAGLRALFASIRRVRDSGGQVAVCSAQPQVRGLLDAVALGTVMCVAGTVDEACRMLTRQPASNSMGNQDSPADRPDMRNRSSPTRTVGARSAYREGVR